MEAIRTCIGCRAQAPRAELIRLVRVENRVEIDSSKTLPGRGAWLHASQTCLDKAVNRRAIGRALRVSKEIETSKLREQADWLMDK